MVHSPVFPTQMDSLYSLHLHVWERLGFRYLMNLITYQHEKTVRKMKKNKNPLSRKDESPKSLITFHS